MKRNWRSGELAALRSVLLATGGQAKCPGD